MTVWNKRFLANTLGMTIDGVKTPENGPLKRTLRHALLSSLLRRLFCPRFDLLELLLLDAQALAALLDFFFQPHIRGVVVIPGIGDFIVRGQDLVAGGWWVLSHLAQSCER